MICVADLAQMLINLPLEGIIVEAPDASDKTLGQMSTDLLSSLNIDASSTHLAGTPCRYSI